MIHLDCVNRSSLCRALVTAVVYIILLLPGDDARNCSPPPPVTGGRYNTSNYATSYPKGTVLKLNCDAGYMKTGSNNVIRCLGEQNKEWELPQFECYPVACGDPGSVANADRTGHLWTFKSKVEYTCYDGYVMTDGDAIRYCQGNTQWSGRLPTCTIINCTKPENPDNGQVFYNDLTYGSILTYGCYNRLTVKGDQTRMCQADGHWSGSMPTCVDVDCGMPNLTFPSGKVKMFQGTRLHDEILYKCFNGITERASCQGSGLWYPPPPDCMNEIFAFEPTTTLTTTSTSTTTTPTTTQSPKGNRVSNFFCKYRLFKWMCVIG